MENSNRAVMLAASAGALTGIVASIAIAATGLFHDQAATEKSIHDYLVAHPQILITMSNALQAQQERDDHDRRVAALNKLGLKSFFDPNVAFVTGPANAKISLAEFFDYNCVHCRNSLAAMKSFYAKHKNDTRFSFIDLPIFGPDSELAAKAAVAARKQPDKYVAFHFALMGSDGPANAKTILAAAREAGLDVDRLDKDMNDPETAKTLLRARKLADAASVDGTPTFVVNGSVQPGEASEELLEKLAKS